MTAFAGCSNDSQPDARIFTDGPTPDAAAPDAKPATADAPAATVDAASGGVDAGGSAG